MENDVCRRTSLSFVCVCVCVCPYRKILVNSIQSPREQIEANIIHNSRLSKRAKRRVYYSHGRILREATRLKDVRRSSVTIDS